MPHLLSGPALTLKLVFLVEHRVRENERERERERERGRERERRERQRERKRERETEIERDSERERETESEREQRQLATEKVCPGGSQKVAASELWRRKRKLPVVCKLRGTDEFR